VTERGGSSIEGIVKTDEKSTGGIDYGGDRGNVNVLHVREIQVKSLVSENISRNRHLGTDHHAGTREETQLLTGQPNCWKRHREGRGLQPRDSELEKKDK